MCSQEASLQKNDERGLLLTDERDVFLCCSCPFVKLLPSISCPDKALCVIQCDPSLSLHSMPWDGALELGRTWQIVTLG